MYAPDNGDRYRAPALDKGLDILELLAATDLSLSQAEIAKSLNRSPNEIYRMLDRLVRRNYVRRTEQERYELTLKLFELAHQSPFIRRLVSHATPLVRHFARDAGQACHLVVYDRNMLVVVAQLDAPGYWSIAIRIGGRMSLINTGSGHVFLAYANDEERALMLEERDDIVTNKVPDDFEQRLAQVKERGYEMMQSLQVSGVTHLSVPIFGPLGTVVATLTCPFIDRLDQPEAPGKKDVLELLIAAGKKISNGPLMARS
ncbi:Transcriptional regulator, IclR family [hydrothermal vent metagenome]|uniref:Transcriptional regulator, IclR family n=1 Tax=hydrothermal vent metagenome TaxID=652676 RepID=A0A3B0TW38_9ZZZZ